MNINTLLAIDPGNELSGYVLYDLATDELLQFGKVPNGQMLWIAGNPKYDYAAIEMIASYGMAVGKTVFETCVMIGRFEQRIIDSRRMTPMKIFRQQVKLEICKTVRANDSNIRAAIIDMYPATGGGKTPQIGTKSNPGPLYGVSKDVWAAIGVAKTWKALYWNRGQE